jgi:predicted nucleic acid-binding Zn ribbon protein
MSKVYDFEYVKEYIESYNYIVISDKNDYENGSSKLTFLDNDNYKYKSSYNSFSATIKNGRPLIFGVYNEYATYNATIWLKNNNRNWSVISRNYNAGKTEYFLFHCNDCGNDFETIFGSVRNMDCQCPYCQRKRVSDINSIGFNFPNSVKYFDIDKNYPNTAYTVAKSSNLKYWWKCKACDYSWHVSPSVLTRHGKFNECPMCTGRIASDKNRLITLYPDIAKEWDYEKNKEFDIMDFKYTDIKDIWWLCNKCGYSYKANTYDRTHGKHGCAACAGRVVTDKNRLNILFPELCLEWDYKNNYPIRPEDVSFGSHIKRHWICPICQKSYESNAGNRIRGKGCPYCNLSGAAQIIYKFLKNKNISFDINHSFSDLISPYKKLLLYDFGIFDESNNIKYLIEYDDIQHEKFIPFWHKTEEEFEYRHQMDIMKNEYAKNNNIPLLRIKPNEIKNLDYTISEFLLINS